MEKELVAKVSGEIDAPLSAVWSAFTDPMFVRQWLFGTDMKVSAWEVGGEITYSGVWEGKSYQDKGKILEIVPGKKLVSSYWSAFSGLPDLPENYQKVTYELTERDGKTTVEITQEGSKSPEQAKHSEGNWRQVLDTMKKLLEK